MAADVLADLRGSQSRFDTYLPHFERYGSRLPKRANPNSNILLADVEARTIRALFEAEADRLSNAFAASLRTFLESHQGLRPFYPAIERNYDSIRSGRNDEPLPLDAVAGFSEGIKFAPATLVDPPVGALFVGSAEPLPDITPKPPPDGPAKLGDFIRPPADPLGEINPRKQRDFTVAAIANRFWGVFVKGKDAPGAIEGWAKTYNDLEPHIARIIDWLKDFWPGDGPPIPPTISM